MGKKKLFRALLAYLAICICILRTPIINQLYIYIYIYNKRIRKPRYDPLMLPMYVS